MIFPGFKYRGFGVNIRSNIEFPELFPADFEEEDIEIQFAEFDDPWFRAIDPDLGGQQIHPGTYRLQIPGVGRFMVSRGRLLKMASDKSADAFAFRMYALTYAMSACIIQRRHTLLHASGIFLNEKVILFAGESGAGKSTIISKFNLKGFSIFTDDVCVLDGQMSNEGQMLASASYPIIKLDTKILARDFPHVHPLNLWPDSEKKGVRFHETFDPCRYPLACVIIISTVSDSSEVQLKPLQGLDAFRQLGNCVYRKSLIRNIGQQGDLTRVLTNLAGNTPIFNASRPALPDEGNALLEVLEKFILDRFHG